MTPPETHLIGKAANGDTSPAVLSCPDLTVLTQRRDFQRAARGKRVAMAGFVLQMLERPEPTDASIRIGYTCSKKVGNAVARNRAKRRLRALANSVLPHFGRNGWDYVLIGRAQTTINQPFDMLLENLRFAIKKLHQSETR